MGALLLLMLLLLLSFASFWAGRPTNHVRNYLGPSANGLIAFSDGNTVDTVRVDGTGRHTISDSGDIARTPLFSSDGSRVAYIAASSQGGLSGTLVAVDVHGGRRVVLSGDIEVTANMVPNFAWSPDGSQLIFAGNDSGISRIYLVRSDGTVPTPITDSALNRDLPTWSRDGQRLVYRAIDPDGVTRSIEIANIDGSDSQIWASVIAPDSFLSRADWGFDDHTAAYAINLGYGQQTKSIIDLGAGHVLELGHWGNGGWIDYGVRWSGDGRFLAFLTNGGVEGDAVVADSDTNTPYDGQLRVFDDIPRCWVDWSPDNTALFGASGDHCDHLDIIPIDHPEEVIRLPMQIDGAASWQPIRP